jgi:hypothetical protein
LLAGASASNVLQERRYRAVGIIFVFHNMASLILIIQQENPTGLTRFRNYLSRHKWYRQAPGVYHRLFADEVDKEKMWQHCQKEFGIHPERDFFAIYEIDESRSFRGTTHYYSKQGPRWPRDEAASSEDLPQEP